MLNYFFVGLYLFMVLKNRCNICIFAIDKYVVLCYDSVIYILSVLRRKNDF